jgi:hypothetical protein
MRQLDTVFASGRAGSSTLTWSAVGSINPCTAWEPPGPQFVHVFVPLSPRRNSRSPLRRPGTSGKAESRCDWNWIRSTHPSHSSPAHVAGREVCRPSGSSPIRSSRPASEVSTHSKDSSTAPPCPACRAQPSPSPGTASITWRFFDAFRRVGPSNVRCSGTFGREAVTAWISIEAFQKAEALRNCH